MSSIWFTDRTVESLKHYCSTLRRRKYDPLTPEEERELGLRMRKGDSDARVRLINGNLRYVVTVAKKYNATKAPLEDLIQAGNEGLLKAVDKFDPAFCNRVITYATWYIENEVSNAAYSHLRRDLPQLDDYVDGEKHETRLIDFVEARNSEAPDWKLRYDDALVELKFKVGKRQYGLDDLLEDLHAMLLHGYSTSDFARRHNLNERTMKRLLTILSEEASHSLRPAA